MSQGSTIGEAVGALIWSASAVAIAGYTFDAFKTTYSAFPGISGGLGSAPAPFTSPGQANIYSAGAGLPTGKPKPDKAGSFKVTQPGSAGMFGGTINAITNWLGITKSPDQTVPPKNRPARQQDTALNNAVRSRNKQQALNLINQVWRQQNKRGWNKADMQAWIDSRPWGSDLVGLLASK